jgi:hypothetical protein
MIHVTKGLVVAEPWIDLILSGQKTWEMRSTAPALRGWFGLIRKGSGAVCGVAQLVDVGRPLSPDEMVASFDKHRIPVGMIRSGEVARWNTPWVLGEVHSLPHPVPYRHRPGAVTWVTLDPDVTDAVARLAPGSSSARKDARPNTVANTSERSVTHFPRAVSSLQNLHPCKAEMDQASEMSLSQPLPPMSSIQQTSTSGMWGEVQITAGNIKNNHFYLRSFINHFPADLIGGSNRSNTAQRTAVIDWGGPTEVETDIDGEKQFFRARAWIARFYADNAAAPGDRVRVEETGPYSYRVSLRKKGAL